MKKDLYMARALSYVTFIETISPKLKDHAYYLLDCALNKKDATKRGRAVRQLRVLSNKLGRD